MTNCAACLSIEQGIEIQARVQNLKTTVIIISTGCKILAQLWQVAKLCVTLLPMLSYIKLRQ